jgi:hypothetical protein
MLSACFDKPLVSLDTQSGVPATNTNTTPTISGSPPTSIRVGERYSFTPSASDADGDALTFSIANKPTWANFHPATGRLTGIPRDTHAGVNPSIRISVSDGASERALSSFSISVNQIALGSTTLSWMPPTQNTNGSNLTNLAGYRIYYGRSANALDQVITITNSGLTSYVIENLSPATWHFSMTSINAQGIESARSATESTSIT